MFNFFKSKQEQPKQEAKKQSVFDSIDNISDTIKNELYQNGYNSSFQVKPKISDTGMDSSCYSEAYNLNRDYGINPYVYNWYASQSFIGFQTMAIIGQNGMISKAMNIPAKDAIRKGWKVTCNDDLDIDPKVFDRISELDKKYRLREKLVNQSVYTKLFGIRVALFEVSSTDPKYYEKPFNIDGVKANSYKGIKQIDPVWCTPDTTYDNVSDPANLNFYEPTYWQINGRRYHKSHLIITRGDEVADILKPTYQYAGLSLTQKIYQRLYASERTADEVPLLVQTKRMNVYKMEDISTAISNMKAFWDKMKSWIDLRDNFGFKFIGKDDEIQQTETSLADLDVNIMTQFQLFCALVNVPSYKLLNAPMKGFSSGETEEASYREELENIQDFTLTPLLDRHYELLIKSEIKPKYKVDFNPTVKWNELDSVTELERSQINMNKSTTYANLSNAGLVSQDDVSKILIEDETSDFHGMELTEPEEYDLSQYEENTNEN